MSDAGASADNCRLDGFTIRDGNNDGGGNLDDWSTVTPTERQNPAG
jgi:hypothetical protein